MKTAKEILNHHYSFVDGLDEIEYSDLLSAISFAQENAYNQAIDDCCETADKCVYHVSGAYYNDILKLKK